MEFRTLEYVEIEPEWSNEIAIAIEKMKRKKEIEEKRKIIEREGKQMKRDEESPKTVTYHYSTPHQFTIPRVRRQYLKPYFIMAKEAKRDFTKLAENKRLERHPVSFMGRGLLGYTILGWSYMVVRDDLVGETKEIVDLHESIHTNDEYETRVITSWMLDEYD